MPRLDDEAVERNCRRLLRDCADSVIYFRNPGELAKAIQKRDMIRGIQLVMPSDITVAAYDAACRMTFSAESAAAGAAVTVDSFGILLDFYEKCEKHRETLAALGRSPK